MKPRLASLTSHFIQTPSWRASGHCQPRGRLMAQAGTTPRGTSGQSRDSAKAANHKDAGQGVGAWPGQVAHGGGQRSWAGLAAEQHAQHRRAIDHADHAAGLDHREGTLRAFDRGRELRHARPGRELARKVEQHRSAERMIARAVRIFARGASRVNSAT